MIAGSYFFRKYRIIVVVATGILLFIIYVYRAPLWEAISHLYHFISDREAIQAFISSFGLGAPFVFMGIQILQVIFAPVPGEATGFIGGYLFGVFRGFLFSSVALAVGSWINFIIGRFFGERYVRKIIPPEKFEKFDRMLKRQGIIVIFIWFIFPGFPKDYLCLFLGLSTLPLRVFLLLAAIGRMPGTFALSLQGAFLFEKNYIVLAVVSGACLLLAFLVYWYRERLYLWVERLNSR